MKDLIDFLFPRFCHICDDRLSAQEKHICISCLANLPRTGSHLSKNNNIEKIFWGRLPIERACSFFFYENLQIRNLIWQFKYKGIPDIGRHMAAIYACEIRDSGFFDGIDAIIPVPLSWLKHIRRGYNQCEYIAEGISKETGIPIYSNVVRRKRYNTTQTHLSRQERYDNVDNIFKLIKPEKIRGKHILIVDDVLTTGATVCSLGKTLCQAGDVRISVLSLALAGELKGVPQSPQKVV